jgi:maltose O-acetyltransferase
MAGYTVGDGAFVGEDLIIVDEPEDRNEVIIGLRVAIAPRVTLVVSSRPQLSQIGPYVRSAHGRIIIGDDAWLGTGCIVLPGVRIGNGAVVGAGAVVTRDVPDYGVVAGVPAKLMSRVPVSVCGAEQQELRQVPYEAISQEGGTW